MVYTVSFNSGLSADDTISVKIKASSKEEALEIALHQNPELFNWKYFIN
jgi:hypothetical protein